MNTPESPSPEDAPKAPSQAEAVGKAIQAAAEQIAHAVAQCLHCSGKAPKGKRGLCHSCYRNSSIRSQYPVRRQPKHSVQDYTHITKIPALPALPTTAAPGTPEKIRVMTKRARQKTQIRHPADARYEGDPRPLLFLQNQNKTTDTQENGNEE